MVKIDKRAWLFQLGRYRKGFNFSQDRNGEYPGMIPAVGVARWQGGAARRPFLAV